MAGGEPQIREGRLPGRAGVGQTTSAFAFIEPDTAPTAIPRIRNAFAASIYR
jgi:hypothetical protein